MDIDPPAVADLAPDKKTFSIRKVLFIETLSQRRMETRPCCERHARFRDQNISRSTAPTEKDLREVGNQSPGRADVGHRHPCSQSKNQADRESFPLVTLLAGPKHDPKNCFFLFCDVSSLGKEVYPFNFEKIDFGSRRVTHSSGERRIYQKTANFWRIISI